jgi:ferredoxin
MRVRVDNEICQGHARCWDLCPEVFSLDEQGHAFVATMEIPEALVPKVQRAVDSCPERAIQMG